MSIRLPQNPGIGGINELTDSEEDIIQIIAALGSAGQVLATNAGVDSVEWTTVAGSGDMIAATYDPATIAEQLVGLTATQTLTNKTLTAPVIDYVDFDLTAAHSVAQGELTWNADEETLDLGLNGAVLQLGQESHYHVRNTTGITITNGTLVMANGTVGASGRITVTPMVGSTIANAKYFLGITTEDIATATDGKVTEFGKVRGIQTNGANYGETWVDGDVIWVDPTTTGALTNVAPTTGIRLPVAFVIYAHLTAGTLAVRATSGHAMDEMHDVTITSIATGELLKWNGTNWINNTLAEADIQSILTEGAFVDGDKTKLDYISVTQAVNLDQMETDINALSDGMTYKGDWDASVGTFPGGGTAQTGAMYYVSVSGTVDSVSFAAGDNIIATTDNASTTVYAANWSKHDQTDAVASVNTKVGSVVLDPDDLDDAATAHKFVTATDLTNLGNLSGTNTGDEVVATGAEVDTGTDNVKMVTPKAVADSGVLFNTLEDTTPELGGELDSGAHSIGFTMQTATGDGTTTIDWKLGNHFDFTFGAFNEVFTFTAPTNSGVYTLSLKQDSVGSRTATFPTVKWTGGSAPTLTTTATTGYDLIAFRYDGTSYYGTSTLNFS